MTKFTFQFTIDYNDKTKQYVVHTTPHKTMHSPVRAVKRTTLSTVSNVVTRGGKRKRNPPKRLINEAN